MLFTESHLLLGISSCVERQAMLEIMEDVNGAVGDILKCMHSLALTGIDGRLLTVPELVL